MRTVMLLAACSYSFSALPAPIPVILDTDLGDDIDDTWALAMILGTPQLDLKLVVTACDDTVTKARLVAKILDKMGYANIPIGIGVKTSDNKLNQADWLGDYALDAYPGEIHEDGVKTMIDAIKASGQPITLLVIGPQMNIKAALDRDPSIARNARVVSMAGSIEIGYDGRQGRSAEYNVRKDIAAARAVLAAPWGVTYAPLDCCATLRLTGERYAKVASSENPRATVTIANYDMWSLRRHNPENASSILFDTTAVYLCCAEDVFDMKTVKLSIDDEGNTVPDENGRPVRCGTGWKDRDAFEELLVKSLTGE